MKQEIDNQLLLEVLKKDKKSTKIFIDIIMSVINGALYRFDQLSKEDREDITQNIIVREIYGKNGDWIGIRKFRGDSKFTTYLYKIVSFRALDFLKSKNIKYRPKTDSIDNKLIDLSFKEMSKNDKISIDKAIERLKDKEKKIIILLMEGYKHREIGEKLKISTNTISSLISRALKKMKYFLQEN